MAEEQFIDPEQQAYEADKKKWGVSSDQEYDNLRSVIGNGMARRVSEAELSAKEMKWRQGKAAKDFRQNLGNYKNQANEGALSDYRNNVAQGLQKSKEGFARRGLLNSGIRESAEGGFIGNQMASLAQERQAISEQLDSKANEYDAQALNSELAVNNMQAQIQQDLYNKALAERQNRRDSLNSFLGSVGGVAGTVIGRAK